MPEIKAEDLQKKIEAGEELTPEEMKEVMSEPNPDTSNKGIPPEDDFDVKDDPESGEKAAEAKAAEEAKKKEEAAKAEAEKKAAEEAAKAKESEAKEDDLSKILEEVDKPDGQEDLSNLTKREVGLFWQMRRDRRARQKAEEERDALRFKELKRKQEEDAKAAKEKEEADPFKDRNPEDILTVKDLKILLEKTKPTSKASDRPFIDMGNPITRQFFAMAEEKAKTEKEDYDEVMECSDQILAKNEGYLRQIAAALMEGKNPAIVMYNLIKGDPEFPKVLPAAKEKVALKNKADGKDKTPDPAKDPQKEKERAEALEKQKKLEENKDKPKTSAHASGADESNLGEYTAEQLLDMSDAEFAKVPKKIREKFLKECGV